METIIELQNVSKVFRLPHERPDALKEYFLHLGRKTSYEEFWALRDCNIAIQKGEFISFVGPNGAGKTTLLRLIAKVYAPTSGEVHVKGAVAPFMELSAGFQPELTCLDNIYLYGAIIGLSRRMVRERLPDIFSFSGLEKYKDQKVKFFSSGMHARLAFSISIHADADILLVDEVLSVGDQEFQEKCLDVFRRYKTMGKTIVFVSHDLNLVQQFSDRVGFLRGGSLRMLDQPEKVLEAYRL